MGKEIFAKLIELDDHQVLVTKEYEDSDNSFKVVQTTELEDARAFIGMGFYNEKKRDDLFDEYGKKHAEKFIAQLKEII